MEDGRPFCPNCNAPQIRVRGLAGQSELPPLPEMPGEVLPPTESVLPRSWPAQPVPPPLGVQWPQALPSAAIAGFLLAIAMAVPFATPFLLMVASGGFAVALYARRSALPVSPRMGARVGLLGGLFSWMIMAAVLAMEIAFGGGHLIGMLRDALQQQFTGNSDPRAQEVLEKLNTPGGMTVLVAAGMLIFLIVVLIAGAAGGAIGASLLGKSRRKE